MGTPVTNRTLPFVLGITMIIPAAGSLFRVFDLTSQWDWALKFAATHVDNLPLMIHAISAVTFLILGAFQILPGIRNLPVDLEPSERPRKRRLRPTRHQLELTTLRGIVTRCFDGALILLLALPQMHRATTMRDQASRTHRTHRMDK